MKRAAVIIGVDRTGTLPRLNDASLGARKMADWAESQKFDTVLITDQSAPVTAQDIRAAVTKFVKKGVYEQLLVYFAGHGVNIRYGEYWLLSDAPDDTQAAVNVEGSAMLARYSGIGHVVFISDACRTAAEGVRAQFVTGSEIFPNAGIVGEEGPVDQFYACTLGRPAYEVRDPADAASHFSALYTAAVLAALRGDLPEAVDWGSGPDGAEMAYVRPRLLKRAVAANVSERIKAVGLQADVIQAPDARICSDGQAWLACLPELPPAALRGTRTRRQAAPTAADTAALQIKLALDRSAEGHNKSWKFIDNKSWKFIDVTRAAESAGACQFRLEGAQLVGTNRRPAGDAVRRLADQARVENVGRGGESIVLHMDNDCCVVLPALPDFAVTLSFDGRELSKVAYEPAGDDAREAEYRRRADDIASLRALAAESSQNGVFRLDGGDGLRLAQRMQYAKGIDPALALYAAYAYDSLQHRNLIRQMGAWMEDDLGACWFDLAMLAGRGSSRQPRRLLSPFPMLAQGWSRLSALDIPLPASLRDVQQHLVSSLWTVFDHKAAGMLLDALAKGELQ